MDTPQVLLDHHLKTLRLPTFLREYDKVAQQCAAEGVDFPRYLLRLSELELTRHPDSEWMERIGHRATQESWGYHRMNIFTKRGPLLRSNGPRSCYGDSGYRLVTKRPKYAESSVQKYGVSPKDYYLFELE